MRDLRINANGDLLAGAVPGKIFETSDERGSQKEVHIALRTDAPTNCAATNVCGTGTAEDPFDGSTQARFDAVTSALLPFTRIHLGPGTFITRRISLKDGWEFVGAGEKLTVIKLADNQVANGDYPMAVLIRYDSEGFLSAFSASDLTIDCNIANQPAYSNAVARARVITADTTNASTTITAAGGAFTSADLGLYVAGPGIPIANRDGSGNRIASVTNSTTVVLTTAATLTQTGATVKLSGNASIGVIHIAANSGSLQRIHGQSPWSDPGEGFVFAYTTAANGGPVYIDRCSVDGGRGYQTIFSIFHQGFDAGATGAITNCRVTDSPGSIGFGSGAWKNFILADNETIGCAGGLVIDTWDYARVTIVRNKFLKCNEYGVLINGPGPHTGMNLLDNTVQMSREAGGRALHIEVGEFNIQGNTFSTERAGVSAVHAGREVSGRFLGNTIVEPTATDLSGSNLSVDGNTGAEGHHLTLGKSGER